MFSAVVEAGADVQIQVAVAGGVGFANLFFN